MTYPIILVQYTAGHSQYRWTFEAQNGAQGSFSYLDVAKYGQRDYKTNFATERGNKLIIPGGGGGARPMPLQKRGSKSPGYSPNGIVLLRLVRIV